MSLKLAAFGSDPMLHFVASSDSTSPSQMLQVLPTTEKLSLWSSPFVRFTVNARFIDAFKRAHSIPKSDTSVRRHF